MNGEVYGTARAGRPGSEHYDRVRLHRLRFTESLVAKFFGAIHVLDCAKGEVPDALTPALDTPH